MPCMRPWPCSLPCRCRGLRCEKTPPRFFHPWRGRGVRHFLFNFSLFSVCAAREVQFCAYSSSIFDTFLQFVFHHAPTLDGNAFYVLCPYPTYRYVC